MKFFRRQKIIKIVLTLFVASSMTIFLQPLFAAELSGTKLILSKQTIGDPNQVYAVTDANFIEGGHMQVPNRLAMLGNPTGYIPGEATSTTMIYVSNQRRKLGMLVTDLDDSPSSDGTGSPATYRLVRNRFYCDPAPALGELDRSADGNQDACATTIMSDWQLIIPSMSTSTTAGKFLTNDGQNISWGTLSGGTGFTISGVGILDASTTLGLSVGSGLIGSFGYSTSTISLDLTHANEWSGLQTFDSGMFALKGSATGTVRLLAAASSTDYLLTLPDSLPATSGLILASDASGTLSWAPQATGTIGGTISAGQVAFGTSTDTIAGTNNFLFTNGLNPFFSVGDLTGAGHGTALTVNDATQNISATGTVSVVLPHAVGSPVITGDTSLGTFSGTYDGYAGYPYGIGPSIDGINDQTINYTSETGAFVPGDTVTGVPSGASGTVGTDASGTLVIINNTGGIPFAMGDTITDVSTSFTLTADISVSSFYDSFTYDDGFTYWGVYVPIDVSTPYVFGDGLSFTFTPSIGHYIGENLLYSIYDSSFSPAITINGFDGTRYFTVNAVAQDSNFIGYQAGQGATHANNSNFLGANAGNSAINANNSNFLGANAGDGATNANNAIFIGKKAGISDTVNNSTGGTSILIGDNTGTGGNSNSVAIGAGAVNTAANQFLVKSTSPFTDIALDSGTGVFRAGDLTGMSGAELLVDSNKQTIQLNGTQVVKTKTLPYGATYTYSFTGMLGNYDIEFHSGSGLTVVVLPDSAHSSVGEEIRFTDSDNLIGTSTTSMTFDSGALNTITRPGSSPAQTFSLNTTDYQGSRIVFTETSNSTSTGVTNWQAVIIKNSTGGGSITLAPNQVGFASTTGTLIGTNNFLFNDNGINPVLNVGDLTGVGNGTAFSINDSTRQISATGTMSLATVTDMNVFSIKNSVNNYFSVNAVANLSTFIGVGAGHLATNANNSNFLGANAGNSAINANNSNFLGANAGNSAANANFSNFLGANAGDGATNANNAIFIGKKAGISDTVNNSTGGTSILIGDNTGTGGNSNSVAIGAGAVNTAANQFLVKSTSPFTDIALDSSTGLFRVGDLSSAGNGTKINLSDSSKTINASGNVSVVTGYSLGSTTCALTCSPNDITITGTYTGVGPTTYSLNIMTPAIRYQYVTVSNITGYVPFGTVTATGLRSGTVVAIFPTPGFALQGTLLLRINSPLDFSGVSLISAPLTTVISTSANTDYVRLTEGGTSVYFGLLSGVSPAYPAGVVSSLDGIGVTATTQYNHTASIFTASVTPVVSTTPTSALKLDFNNQKYQFGDYAYSENGNALSINDASNSTLFTSKYGGAQHTTLSLQGGTTGLFSIGDVDNAVHGTKISINDNTQAITFNGHYSFPFSDGLSGQTLSTNGSGVLSWATSTSGTSTFSGSIALGQVAFGSATNTISGNGDFLFTASSTPIFKVGDILNAGHFTKFVLNDASGTDSFYNNIFSIYDNIATTSKFLDINSASGALGHASIGDINNLRGGGYFSINNMSSSWSASISDYAGGATTTYFRVSPSSKSYSFGNPADTNITIDDTSTSTTPKTVLVTASDLRIVSPASSMTPDAFTIQDIPGNRYFTVNAIIPNLNAIGVGAGVGAGSASDSNFIGVNAGNGSTAAYESNFLGYYAGSGATSALGSNFLGADVGLNAINASRSNFFGSSAGVSATNANNSNFFGYNSGNGAANANNSIFLGNSSGYGDIVNNSGGGTSILIGDNTNTGGHSDSVAIGNGAVNTAANQFLIRATSTHAFTDIALDSSTGTIRLGDLLGAGSSTKIVINDTAHSITFNGNYSFPYSDGTSGQVLKTDGAGNISWATSTSGIGGTIGVNQVAFGSATDTIVGSENFKFIDGTNPIFKVGDYGTGNGTRLSLDDSTQLISATGNVSITNVTSTNAFSITSGGNNYFNVNAVATLSTFIGVNAGIDATSASRSNFFGVYAGYQATNANDSNFFGQDTGYQATNANYSNFLGADAGIFASNAYDSNFFGASAGQQATNADESNFFGRNAGYQATNANDSNFSGPQSGQYATNASSSNFMGYWSGYGAINAANSNFMGYRSGNLATDAHDSNFFGYKAGFGIDSNYSSNSNFFGNSAGIYASNASSSNFFGLNAGYSAINADHSNFLGENAGYNATNASSSNFLGMNAGQNSTSTDHSNFLGENAGYNATNASSSNFFGVNAGASSTNSYYANFFGINAGSNTNLSLYSNFIGENSGSGSINSVASDFIGGEAGQNSYNADSAQFFGYQAGQNSSSTYESVFIGGEAGQGSVNSHNSNFLGKQSGMSSTNSYLSNFIGFNSGSNTSNSQYSNFIGMNAGAQLYGLSSASHSNFIGYQAGEGVNNANNSIFIGDNSGFADAVDNSATGTSSILIGDNTNTGGHSDSVAIGNGAVNTAANQFLIRATSTHAFTDIALDSSTGTMRFGDLLNTSSSTKFVLDATSKSSTFYNNLFSINDNVASTSSFLNINTTAGSGGSVALGDINNLRNSGVFSFNGMSSSWDASITDQAGGTTNTYFQVAPSAGSYFLGNPNSTGLYITDSTSTPSLEFRITNPASSVFTIIDDSGLNYFTVNAIIPNLNAIGAGAGVGATSASHSNFFGYRAGSGATSASYSNFFGSGAGYGAAGATGSNFLGESAGYGAVNADGSNFFGYVSGYGATGAEGSNFFGNSAGYGASNAQESNFLGGSAGQNATNAFYSNFFGNLSGVSASNANNSNFFGANSGYQATNASSSNFFGLNAGIGATNANNSNFLGYYSGGSATSSDHSNFIGYQSGQYANHANSSNFIGFGSGYQATNASSSNFLGVNSGTNANNSSYSNFFGTNSGWGASSSSYSNFMGYQAGFGASSAKNSIFIGSNAGNNATNSAYSIFIGNNAGLNDTVSNGATNTSILIGSNTNTGGYKDSVAIGNGAVNTSADQFLVSSTGTSSFKNMRFILKTGVGAGGKFEVQDNSLSSNKFLSLDASTDTYSFGDITGYNNSSYIKIEDSSLPSDGLITMNHSVLSVNSSLGHTCTLDPDVSGSVTCTSDVRLKTNINNLPDTLAQINSLRPVTYNWISSGTSSDLHTGFIAQEMQKVFPQFVSVVDTKNGYLGIDYGALTVPIVKAIQEMDIKLEPLTSLDVTQDGSLASLIKKYLENALNGIQVLFAGKVQTKELCLDDLCVTKTELQQMMNQANVQGAMLIVPPAITSTTTATTTTTDASSTTVSTSTSLFVLPVISTSTSTATTTAATVTATSTPDTSSSSTVSIVPITAPTPVIAPVSVSTDTNSAPVVVPSLGTTVSGSATTTQ